MNKVEVMMSEGAPVSFTRDGRTWHVGAKPAHWFERVDWWKTARRIPRLLDVQCGRYRQGSATTQGAR